MHSTHMHGLILYNKIMIIIIGNEAPNYLSNNLHRLTEINFCMSFILLNSFHLVEIYVFYAVWYLDTYGITNSEKTYPKFP